MVDLTVKIGDTELDNPVMPASGTFSYEFSEVIDPNRLGAMVAKTVSRDFRAGCPPPRMAETEVGIIQSIGLPTNGLQYFLDEQLPEYKRFTPPLVASISAEDVQGFTDMARDISVSGVDVVEANISCPTRDPSGGNFSLQVDHTRNVVAAIRAATDKPVWAKLSPNAGDVVGIALAAEEAGADALVVANTFLALKIDTNTFRPALGNKFGGLVGPSVKPIILRMVYQIAQEVSIPIIGVGGVSKAEDVVEYMLAGASAVGVGYASFRNPTALPAIIDELEKWCDDRMIERVVDLTGAIRDGDMETDTFVAASTLS